MTLRHHLGRLIVRAVARVVRLLYPSSFRDTHREDFTVVADHLFERESHTRRPMSAMLETSRLLLRDTAEASPRQWLTALRELAGGAGHDLKLAWRAARRRPGFSALVIGTLGLGIGASAAAFDALDRAVLRPFPFQQSEQLMLVVMKEVDRGFMTSVPPATFHHWRASSTTLQGVEVFRRMSSIRSTPTHAHLVEGLGVSGGLPALLGVRPIVGRTITEADAAADAPTVVMLGEQFWRREYGADPAVVGRQITIANRPAQIIGVWPLGARLDYFEPPDVYRVLPAGREYTENNWVQIVARMTEGTTVAHAEAELRALTTPEQNKPPLRFHAVAVTPAELLLGTPYLTGVWLVFGGALVLLLVAMANAAHLLLARGAARERELSIRMALGSSRLRIARLFVCEAMVYAAAALVLGAALAIGLERLIASSEPRLFRDALGAGLMGRTFYFAAGVALLTTLICALIPVRSTGKPQGTMRWLVAAQAALAVLLVFGAVLMTRSLTALTTVNTGIDVDRLAEIPLSLPAARYPSPESRQLLYERAATAIHTLPGVTGVARSRMPLLLGALESGWPRLDDELEVAAPPATNTVVSDVEPHYFDVVGMRLLAGRTFSPGEPGVVVVSDGLARRYREPILGRRLFVPGAADPATIVGIVSDVRYAQLANDEGPNQPAVYVPATPFAGTTLRLFVRTNGDPAELIGIARSRLAEIDPAVALLTPKTGVDVIDAQTAQQRFVATLLSGLAAFGFLLAMSGVYGAVSLGVAHRTREVGVRMALGAQVSRLVGTFVVRGLRPVLVGALVGSTAAWFAAPYAEVLLYRVPSRDPLSAAAGLAVVVLTSALAAVIPARRIAEIDPARTLRST